MKGPIIDRPITSMEGVQQLHVLDLDQLTFVGDALKQLRQEVGNEVAALNYHSLNYSVDLRVEGDDF